MKRRILEQCLEISRENLSPEKHPQYAEYIHFTYVIQRNKILEWGTNMAGNPRFGYKAYMKIHSEYVAYQKARTFIRKDEYFEIINIRLNRKGCLKMSKPCKCCLGFLTNLNCKNVFFTTEAGFSKMLLND